jgi:type I restriction enzyme S subunit
MSSGSKDLVGKAAQAKSDLDYAFGVFCSVVRPVPVIERKFLGYYFQGENYRRHVAEVSSGVNINNLRREHIEDVTLPLAPLYEQQRIVAKIDELFSELDAGVASLKRARELLKKYRQAVLKAAVTGELTRDWRERQREQIEESGADLLQRILKERRQAWEAAELKKMRAQGKPPKDDRWKQKYKEPQPPDTAALPALPQGWVWVSLDQLIVLITSGSRGWRDYYANSGSLFIRAQNLKNDALDLRDAAYVDLPGRTEGVRTRVMDDDILVTITGANVTKSALVNLSLPEAYVSQHVGLVRLAIRDCAKFVHSWIICPSLGRKYLLGAAYGAGKPGLNLDNLRDLVLALPPLEEQHEISGRIDQTFSNLDSISAQISTQLHHSGGLRQSILKAAFAGKLVPQNPNDEPASVLLKRIRAERAASPLSARGRRVRKGPASDRQLELLP